ncbi:MAG TPA: SRPBCC family protein [Baekduia sp.]|uniref:SRPBCC family protein n=1 Tax=Baekduia sp. TaxID=2600305 RepID=UPI002C1900F2|nr:SRPBCC family protein [Baekduia sp.]HMJ33498.1 SRPBCC family protein [Baekduia sp.]
MTEQTADAVVRRTVTVAAPVARAYDVFTSGMASWWPKDTHHVGPTPAEAVIEPFVDGRCYARAHDGTETDWGRVLAWEPPSRLVFAWLLTPQWGFEPDPALASEVEVRFTATGEDSTEVVLTHSGFERYAEGGETMRAQVDGAGGWGALLDLYVSALR